MIEELHIAWCPISDSILRCALTTCPYLRFVDFSGTSVTEETIAELRKHCAQLSAVITESCRSIPRKKRSRSVGNHYKLLHEAGLQLEQLASQRKKSSSSSSSSSVSTKRPLKRQRAFRRIGDMNSYSEEMDDDFLPS